MSELLEHQILFAMLVPRLIEKAFAMGYAVTLGDAYRDPRCPYGSEVSLHKQRLAIDLNLYKRQNGSWKYLDKSEDHKPLGEWWESQHANCAWGGHFNDGNHYSFKIDRRE